MSALPLLVDDTWDFERPGEASQRLWSVLLRRCAPTKVATLNAAKNGPWENFPLSLPGRYLMPDGSEFPCQTLNISPKGLTIRCPSGGHMGEWVVAHIRGLGSVEGVIDSKGPTCFVIDVRATPVRLERLTRKIAWHVRRQFDDVPERRRHERVETYRRKATLETSDGRRLIGELMDISKGGAAVCIGDAALYLWGGQSVALDGRPAEVLRRFPGGVVVKFEELIEPDEDDEL